jgi:hypothetical protein
MVLQYKDLAIEIQRMWNRNKSHTSYRRGKLKSSRKYLKNTSGKQRELNTENSHIGYCVHTSGSNNVEVQRIVTGNNITCITICKHRTATRLYVGYTLEHGVVTAVSSH